MSSRKPRLLDLFCGAGGAAMGYSRAGFDVTGVDIERQPHYPFKFLHGDALEVASRWVTYGEFDAIHASPPCQFYSRLRSLPWLRDKEYWDSIPPTRALLQTTGLPWIMENVENAPMPALVLCGTMFGLEWPDGTPLYRHRRFETNIEELWLTPGHPRHYRTLLRGRLLKGRARRAMGAMGIDWMTGEELSQAIPPAYTEWIGHQLMAHLRADTLAEEAK